MSNTARRTHKTTSLVYWSSPALSSTRQRFAEIFIDRGGGQEPESYLALAGRVGYPEAAALSGGGPLPPFFMIPYPSFL